jgi:CRP/FNR family transcriptional regulator
MLLGRATPDERLLAFLLMWRERQACGSRQPAEIVLPMKRCDIADYLGVNFETVSRSLSKLQRERVIAVRRERIRFIDREQEAMPGVSAIPQWLRPPDVAVE